MLVVPKLGSDPKLVAAQAPVEEPLQHLADLLFIAVDRCAIQMRYPTAIAPATASAMSQDRVIGTEGAKADRRDLSAGV